MKASLQLLLAFVLVLGLSSKGYATYRDLVGFPELQALLGGSIPTGASIGVQHIEVMESGDFMPLVGASQFSGKAILNVSTGGADSSHATNVGLNFYGNVTGSNQGSIAPAIGNDVSNPIKVYEANHWINNVLFPGSSFISFPANDPTSRVANHSWIGNAGASTAAFLRQIDFLADRDNIIQVVGLSNVNPDNPNEPFWKDGFNVISVGTTDVNHKPTTLAVDSVYVAGRTAPTLVAPGFSNGNGDPRTSWATPMVSAAAALLIEVGRDQPSLSLDRSYTVGSRTFNEAESGEVVKALLMAGADRLVDNARGADITSYTINTTNNLNSNYGAGQLNVFNSYRILAAGQQDSVADGNGNDIGAFGWDYDPAFGGASGSNDSASYFFTAGGHGTIFASLVWNLRVFDADGAAGFQSAGELFDLNLELYDVTGGNTLIVSASSLSTIENTENIYFDGLIAGNRYEMRVVENEGSPFLWDYALAWRMELVPEPASFGLLISSIALLPVARRSRNRRQISTRG